MKDCLPIDPIILKMRMEIRVLLAELSYLNPEEAIHYLRIWGEKRLPITTLYKELSECLAKYSS